MVPKKSHTLLFSFLGSKRIDVQKYRQNIGMFDFAFSVPNILYLRFERSDFGKIRKMKYRRPTGSFFPRVGGKTKLAKKIARMIPQHETYVEPFVGGGSVFFTKNPALVEVLNDKDKTVYYLCKDMKKIGDRVSQMNFKCSRRIFEVAKKRKASTPFKRLHNNLIIAKHSYSGNHRTYFGDKDLCCRKGIRQKC